MNIRITLLLSVLAVMPAYAQQLGPSEILARAVEINERDWEEAQNYDYYEREEDGGKVKTYHVVMLANSPFSRLVAISDQPLSADEEAKEQQRFENTASERQRETAATRERRISRYRKERERDRVLMTEITRALEFTLASRETVSGHEVYVLKGMPRRGYRPVNEETKALTGMRGTLWIDAVNFHWVKAEAEVVGPVWIDGFVARVQPGTRFVLEQTPVADGLWLPHHYSMQARAKVLFLFSYHSQEESTYFGYHKRGPAPVHMALGKQTHE
jgi:hypothetical protein